MEQLIKVFAKPSMSFDSNERVRLQKLCESIKRFLHDDMASFIASRAGEPMLLFYGADATPVTTTDVYVKPCGEQTVRRRGRALRELLVQRFFAVACDGTCKVLLDEPMPMGDKSAWTHTEAYRNLFGPPRAGGHRSTLINHFVWDRAIWSACFRQAQQLHHVWAAEVVDDVLPGPLAQRLTWLTSGACCCHDAHNALRWSLLQHVTDPQTLRGLFISIESLRNGFSLLMKNLRPWLCEVVAYEDDHLLPHHDLWVLLGLDPNVAEVAEALQLRWDGGKMKVAERWADDGNVWEAIELVVTHIWAFRKYSESRWLSLGPSCRALLAAQVAGVCEYVQWVLSRPGNSRYYLGGFVDYFTPAVAHLVACLATGCFVVIWPVRMYYKQLRENDQQSGGREREDDCDEVVFDDSVWTLDAASRVMQSVAAHLPQPRSRTLAPGPAAAGPTNIPGQALRRRNLFGACGEWR